MCGILGIVSRNDVTVDSELLTIASGYLASRGPDSSGQWIEGGVGLAHQRLAIQDLTETGHQPMASSDSRYIIVFNGEIYNVNSLREELEDNWRGTSDTELILAAYSAWGIKCLDRLVGMFAFAIWDRLDRLLFVARDRLGVKPLYYSNDNFQFCFSSRPAALSLIKKNRSESIEEQALRYYLDVGYIPAPYSINNGINKLPPAHYLICKDGNIKLERYWNFQNILPNNEWKYRQEEDLLDELDELVTKAVRRRLISDVPIGAFLSGGIDSSLVVAVMAKLSAEPVNTFTIGFRENSFDESRHAKKVADHLGTIHHCEYLEVDDLLQLLPKFHKEFDEPFFDYSAFPTMAVSRLARKHVTVVLSGDGGDEFFGGYHYYKIIQNLNYVYKFPKYLRNFIAESIAYLPGHKLKILSGALKQKDIASAFAFIRSIAKDFDSILTLDVINKTESIKELFSKESKKFNTNLQSVEISMRLDGLYTLPDDYLQKVDLSSMAFSVESREPLLDQELIEWSMRLPMDWKIRGGVNKYLLRKLAYRYIPRDILDRPKQGFSVPIDRWLRGPLKQWAIDRIEEKSLYDEIPLVQAKVKELFALHQSGRRNVHPLLWAILMLLEYVSNKKNMNIFLETKKVDLEV